jgi:HlyD family secretion protein
MSENAPKNMVTVSTDEVRKTIGADRSARSWGWRALRYVVPAGVLLGLVALVTLLRGGANARGPAFETAVTKRGDVKVTVIATGTLQATTTVEVGAEVTGRLLRVNVDANDVVKKGQILAVIDPEQLRAAVAQSAAQVGSARAAIRLARATAAEATLTLARTRLQVAEGLATTRDLESATASAERAAANVDSAVASAALAQAALSQAQSRLGKTTIVSPINGMVLTRLVEPGQTVTAGFTTPILFKLAEDLTQMRLNVDVDEADIGRVREGLEATFTVDAYPERTFPSKVTSLRSEAKTSQNVVTYQAVLSVDNNVRLLRPGMTCTATIVSETRHDVLVVPNAALRFVPLAAQQGPLAGGQKQVGIETDRPEKQRVWLLQEGKPVALPVRAGATDGIVTEIVRGELRPGMAVIVDVKDAK